MHPARLFLTVALSLLANQAQGLCTPIRLGYVDQHRPPYFLGNGSLEARPPGASVDLLREAAAAAGCSIVSARLPPLRLRNALVNARIDATLMNAAQSDAAHFALPLNKSGKLDHERALKMVTVVFVRASDKIAPDTDPQVWFRSHRLGMNNGASLAAQLRSEGLQVDDGAHDGARNLEKLMRGRIDGYAATMVAADGMDASVAATFGQRLIRLSVPLRTHYFWLAYTKPYYHSNQAAAEAIWDWMGGQGRLRFAHHVERYADTLLQPNGTAPASKR